MGVGQGPTLKRLVPGAFDQHCREQREDSLRESGTEDPSVSGMPKEAVDYALKAVKEQPSRNGKRVVSEDWGDMDEADW